MGSILHNCAAALGQLGGLATAKKRRSKKKAAPKKKRATKKKAAPKKKRSR